MYEHDKRTVITLDAGGTHFRFTAIQGNRQIVPVLEYSSEADNLERCLGNLVTGFEETISRLPHKPVAISFAFPGPADYPKGIFPTPLTNFPAFKEGVALGPLLERKFHIPVFINNDADLFTYGEALAGVLPEINRRLTEAGSLKRYHNLIGFILGTGFGFGLTTYNNMYVGDNGCSEIYCLPRKDQPGNIVEDGASLRAILCYYREMANDSHADEYTDTFDIFKIAEGTLAGDREAALHAFARFGEVAGFTIAHAACMLDAIIVLGGGLAKAHRYFLPSMLRELRATENTASGLKLQRVPSYIYNLEDEAEFNAFTRDETVEIPIYGTQDKVLCDARKRLGIAVSHLGTSQATFLGAYCLALHNIDNQQ